MNCSEFQRSKSEKINSLKQVIDEGMEEIEKAQGKM
jgi:hypothetical protein